MPKVLKKCISSAENKKDLHSQCQKWKKSILPMQKMQNICIANARIKKFALPMQSKLKRLHCQKMKITIKIWYFWQGICRIVSNFLVFCYRGLPVSHCLA